MPFDMNNYNESVALSSRFPKNTVKNPVGMKSHFFCIIWSLEMTN